MLEVDVAGPRVVLAGDVGSGTLTDDLLFAGAVGVLEDLDATIVATSGDPEHTQRTHGVPAVPAEVLSLAREAMADADLVLLVGGRVITDLHGPARMTQNLASVCLARSVGRRVLLYGIEVGPVASRVGRQISRTILPLAKGALVRDQPSADVLAELGGLEASVAPDLAFALQPPLIRGEDRIVVCLRPVPQQAEDAFVRAIAGALDDVAERTSLPIHLLALHAGRDDLVHRRVHEHMRAKLVTQSVADLRGVLSELGRSRAVITMHHHGVVGAVLGGRPVVAIDHLGELRGVASGLVERGIVRLLPADHASLGRLAAVLDEVLGKDADVIDVREELRARMIRARSVVERTLHAPMS